MTVTIAGYSLCNGTRSGGVAISDSRPRGDRVFDTALPLDSPFVVFDRRCHKFDFTFIVRRVFGCIGEAEQFILMLDFNLPDSGGIVFRTTSGTTRVIPNGVVIDHALVLQSGATTFHQYHIAGGPPTP